MVLQKRKEWEGMRGRKMHKTKDRGDTHGTVDENMFEHVDVCNDEYVDHNPKIIIQTNSQSIILFFVCFLSCLSLSIYLYIYISCF